MNKKTYTFQIRALIGLLGLAFCCVLLDGQADAQQPAKKDQDASNINVFTLKNTKADDVAKALKELLDVKVVPDPQTNSLLAYLPLEALLKVEAVIAKLEDTAKTHRNTNELFLYPFGKVDPDQSVTRMLQMIIKGKSNSYFMDRDRKILVLSCDEATLREVDKLWQALQNSKVAQPKIEPAIEIPSAQVRVVWLATGIKEPQGVPADLPDLTPLIPHLGGDGGNRLGLVAQLLVNATVGQEFTMKGVAELKGMTGKFPISIRGIFQDDEMERMSFQISAKHSDMDLKSAPLADGEWDSVGEITVPPGKTIVLGIAPMGNMTSVFLIQVIRPQAPIRPQTPKSGKK